MWPADQLGHSFLSPTSSLLGRATDNIAFTISGSHNSFGSACCHLLNLQKHFSTTNNNSSFGFPHTANTLSVQSFTRFRHCFCFRELCATLMATGSVPNDGRCHSLLQRCFLLNWLPNGSKSTFLNMKQSLNKNFNHN